MKPRSRLRSALAAATLAVLLAGCAATPDEQPYEERPVADLYNAAQDLLEAGDYRQAATAFDEVERQHPYSVWATKAQLMSAYAFYQNNDYDEALAALDRFIELHPANDDVAYAYYLRALSFYEQISDVARDQKMTRLALDALEEVIRRFPDSKYARDARLKRDLTIDHLAGKEMTIGRYYQRQGKYLAAINRFKIVVETYQTTTHVPEALSRLIESYLALGLKAEAQRTAAVLGYNFPGSAWYKDSYNLLLGKTETPTERAWYSKAWDWVF